MSTLLKQTQVFKNLQKGEHQVRILNYRIASSDEKNFAGEKKDTAEPWNPHDVLTVIFGNVDGTAIAQFHMKGFHDEESLDAETAKALDAELVEGTRKKYWCTKNKDGSYERVEDEAKTMRSQRWLSRFASAIGVEQGQPLTTEDIDSAIEEKIEVIINVSTSEQGHIDVTSVRAPTAEEVGVDDEENDPGV